MYETIKTVNGYEIARMKGTHGCYHVNISGGSKFYTFKTIKAAVAFCKML